MIALCILVFMYFIFNITSIVNVFMSSIEKKKKELVSRRWKNKRLTIELVTWIKLELN